MAYMSINRYGKTFTTPVADQLNQTIDSIDKKIDNFPNYTKDWYCNNVAPISIDNTLINTSFRKGKSYIINISFSVVSGQTGNLGITITQLRGMSYQLWTSCRSEKGYIYPILIKAGKLYSPIEIAENDIIYFYQIVIL